MTGQSKALMWTGVGLCAAGALGLVVGALLDVEAADPWASVAGGVAALLGLALAVHAGRQGPAGGDGGPSAGTTVTASGTRSVAAGGSVQSAATGDGASVRSPAAPAPPPAAGGSVTASGDRSVAAGGNIGSVSTGDA